MRSLPTLRPGALAPLVLALTIATAACSKKRPEVVPAPVPAATPPVAVPDDRDRLERERLERERAEREAAARARREAIERTMEAPVYFGFDRFDLTTEARALLESKWSVLSTNPMLRIMVEGHADDLGSDEYNLALGMQRAAAVRRFFTQREIHEDRVEIVSFGEERPACSDGATEECRRLNRRAQFRITAGLEAVTAPVAPTASAAASGAMPQR